MALSADPLTSCCPALLAADLRTAGSQIAGNAWSRVLDALIQDGAPLQAPSRPHPRKDSHIVHQAGNNSEDAQAKPRTQINKDTFFNLGLPAPGDSSSQHCVAHGHDNGTGDQSNPSSADEPSNGSVSKDGTGHHAQPSREDTVSLDSSPQSTEVNDVLSGPAAPSSGSGNKMQPEMAFAAALAPKDAGIQGAGGVQELPQTQPQTLSASADTASSVPDQMGVAPAPAAAAPSVMPISASQNEADAGPGSESNEPQFASAPVPALQAQPASMEQTSRPAEPEQPQAPGEANAPNEPKNPSGGKPVDEISVRVTDNQGGRVDLKVVDRAGEVRLTVHGNNTELTKGLRDGLPDLVKGLDHAGYHAEVWRPSEAAASSGNRNPGGSGWDSQPRDGRGNGSNSQGRQDARSGQTKPQPEWVEEMNRTAAREAVLERRLL